MISVISLFLTRLIYDEPPPETERVSSALARRLSPRANRRAPPTSSIIDVSLPRSLAFDSVKKPYNATLGEIFRCSYKYPDGSEGFYVAEQGQSFVPAWPLVASRQCRHARTHSQGLRSNDQLADTRTI